MEENKKYTYYDYQSVSSSVQSLLGIYVFDWTVREETFDYIVDVLKYIEKRLMDLGEDATIKEKVQEVFDIAEEGAKKICQIVEEDLGILYTAEDLFTEVTGDYLPSYLNLDIHLRERDRFVFTWTDCLSSLCTRLRIMYASLFDEAADQGCPCPCGHGETYKDWEAYTSGVYPGDEEYDATSVNGNTGNYNSGNVGYTTNTNCTCGCRK